MLQRLSTLPSVAAQIDLSIRRTGKSVKQIAQDVGVKSNMISMMRSGKIRVPLARVPAIADALDIERWVLMYMCLSEYHPDLYTALEESFPGLNLSPADVDWLPKARRLFVTLLSERRRARKVRRSGNPSMNFTATVCTPLWRTLTRTEREVALMAD